MQTESDKVEAYAPKIDVKYVCKARELESSKSSRTSRALTVKVQN